MIGYCDHDNHNNTSSIMDYNLQIQCKSHCGLCQRHFYIASVHLDEAVRIEPLAENLAAPSNSQGLAVHKCDKTRNRR